MATYSLDLSREYKALDCIAKLKVYFSSMYYENHSDKLNILEMIKKLEQVIKAKILNAVKIWGSALLRDPDTEFVL